jgi:hypothetical protein
MLDQCGQFLRVITSWPARTAFTILAVVGAAGCIPVLREQYYSPEADGATVAPSRCGGGPKAIAEFTVDSVRVGYGLLPGDDSVRPMMSFLVPEGRTVRLLETRMTIQPSGDQGEVRFINLGNL